MKLVEDAKEGWKWFSVQAMSLGAALQAVWMALPLEFKASLSPEIVNGVTFVILLLGLVGRFVKQ